MYHKGHNTLQQTERAQFLIDNLDLEEATGIEGAKWEHFQLQHLNDDATFRIEDKSRQIAWSWTVAAEAVADGILYGVSSVFVSINLDEAKEKIRYAHDICAGLPRRMRPSLVTDNRTETEFDNGARLISLPATPPRGKARMNVYLDEFAHVREDNAIYTAALPMISKGNRRLRIGSSPMGAGGRFWEIFSESLRKYPGYVRKRTPWWETQAFCVDVRKAFRNAPLMDTADRVERFGHDRIKAIYANIPEEDFQQEYECVFVDEVTAWITWDEIKQNQNPFLTCFLSYDNNRVDGAFEAIDKLVEASTNNEVEREFTAGYDVGRTRNTSEFFVNGITSTEQFPLRLAITLDNCEYDDQFAVIDKALRRLPITRMLIDRNGIGSNLAENISRKYPERVQGYDFTAPSKKLLATDIKVLFQQRRVPLPADRAIAYQIHSIKRILTAAKNMVFDMSKNEKHHADKFWSLALSLTAGLEATVRDNTQEASVWSWGNKR